MSKREIKNLRVTFEQPDSVDSGATGTRGKPPRRCKRAISTMIDAPELLQPVIRLKRIDDDTPSQKNNPRKRNKRSASAHGKSVTKADTSKETYKPGKRNQRSASALNASTIRWSSDAKSPTVSDDIKNLITTNCKLTNEILKQNNGCKLAEEKYVKLMEKSCSDLSVWNNKIIQSEEKYIKLLQAGFKTQSRVTVLEHALKSKEETIQQLKSKVQQMKFNSMRYSMPQGKITVNIYFRFFLCEDKFFFVLYT